MPTNPLVGVLTPKIRQIVYVVLALAGVALVTLQIWYDADPAWLGKLERILAYLGTLGLGTMAASNIAKADPQPGPDVVEGDEEGYFPERVLNAD